MGSWWKNKAHCKADKAAEITKSASKKSVEQISVARLELERALRELAEAKAKTQQ